MKTFKTLVFLTFFSLTILSCQSNTYEEISQKDVTNPTYAKNIKPIFNANCISCHSQGGTSQFLILETYEDVKEGCENGDVICRIEGMCGDRMPQGGQLPQSSIDLIKLWKAQGYMN